MMFNMEHVVDYKLSQDSHHTLIIGPGKCGTTLLVKLLTLLDVETGYKQWMAEQKAYGQEGGHVKDSRDPNGDYVTRCEWPCEPSEKADYYFKYTGGHPYVMKSNNLSISLSDTIGVWKWKIDHVYVVTRKTDDIVKRHFYDRFGDKWETEAPKRKINMRKTTVWTRKSALIDNLAMLDLPFTLMMYPRLAEDVDYCYDKLSFLMEKYAISKSNFKEKFDYLIDQKQLRGW